MQVGIRACGRHRAKPQVLASFAGRVVVKAGILCPPGELRYFPFSVGLWGDQQGGAVLTGLFLAVQLGLGGGDRGDRTGG